MSKYCKHCSILNPDSAKFCRNCGKPFLDSVQPTPTPKPTPKPTPTPTPNPTPSSDGIDTFLKVLGTIAVIGICIAIVVWTNGYGAPLGYGAYKAIQSIWD